MSRTALIFEKQWLHASALVLLLSGLVALGGATPVRRGELWGIATPVWFWLSVAMAVAHQVYVWFCWRTQLHGSLLTRALGAKGFLLYAAGFSIFGVARVILVVALAISNRGTLPVAPAAAKLLALIALVPASYLIYSVKRYFGFGRAFGIDHFDARYRSLPFVRQGIFRFARNGMYVYGFLLLWVPGFWFASIAAIAVALFSHLYIWVHYFATERPDMTRIYGVSQAEVPRADA